MLENLQPGVCVGRVFLGLSHLRAAEPLAHLRCRGTGALQAADRAGALHPGERPRLRRGLNLEVQIELKKFVLNIELLVQVCKLAFQQLHFLYYSHDGSHRNLCILQDADKISSTFRKNE